MTRLRWAMAAWTSASSAVSVSESTSSSTRLGTSSRIRSLVDLDIGGLVADVDRPGAVAAGGLGQVMPEQHEVHAADRGRVEYEVLVGCHGPDVAESLPVATDLGEGLSVRARRLLVVDRGGSIVDLDDVSLEVPAASMSRVSWNLGDDPG